MQEQTNDCLHLKRLWFPCTTAPRESVLALLMVSLLPIALKISKTQSFVSLKICCTFTPSSGIIPRGLFSFLSQKRIWNVLVARRFFFFSGIEMRDAPVLEVVEAPVVENKPTSLPGSPLPALVFWIKKLFNLTWTLQKPVSPATPRVWGRRKYTWDRHRFRLGTWTVLP